MGKKLIIKGADFSQVAVEETSYTCEELLINEAYVRVLNGGLTQTSSEGGWHSAIIPLHENMYIENATATSVEALSSSSVARIPAYVFLSGNSLSDYISGSEYFAPKGDNAQFGTFSGYLNPPANATHVVINSHYSTGGRADAVISWDS